MKKVTSKNVTVRVKVRSLKLVREYNKSIVGWQAKSDYLIMCAMRALLNELS